MKVPAILVLAATIVQIALADTPLPIDWSASQQVSVDQRSELLKQALTAVEAAGYSIPSNMTAKAEFLPERDSEPFQEVFFTLQGPSGKLWVRCLYPIRKWLKLYRDWEATSVAEKYGEAFARRLADARKEHPTAEYPQLLDRLAEHPRREAETRARSLAGSVGGVDLTGWQCVSWSFDGGQWVFHFQPFFAGHRLKIDSVSVRLSDAGDLKLCEYHNTMLESLPAYDRVPDVIDQAKAQGLADKYLKQYYRRRDRPSLTFSTNTLEVVRPNYYFTNKYDEKGNWLTNWPRWSWTAQYERNFSTNCFTFSGTPVWIYVDAETGEMLGGTE